MGGRKELTKQRIIEAAVRLISQNGFNATTTALIAKEVGLSETIIFKYFGDKRKLLREIGDLAAAQIVENVSLIPLSKVVESARDYPLREFLRAVTMERLAFADRNFELIKLFVIEMQYDEELSEMAKMSVIPKITEAMEGLQGMIAAKMGVSMALAQTVIRLWLSAVASIVAQKHFAKVRFAPGEIEAELERVFDILEAARR